MSTAIKKIVSILTLGILYAQGHAQSDIVGTLLDSAYSLEATAPDAAIDVYRTAISIAQSEADLLSSGRACSYIGLVHMAQGQYDSLYHYNDQALAIFEKINYQKGIASIYNNQANAYLYQGFYIQAIDYYHKALPYYEQPGEEYNLTIILNNIASLFQHNEDHDQSLNYLQRALLIAKNLEDPHTLGNTYNNLSAGYLSIDDLENAYQYGDSAVHYINMTDDVQMQIKIEGNLARAAALTGRQERAKRLLEQMKSKASNLKNQEIDIVIDQSYARYYQSIGEHGSAIRYGKMSLAKLQVFKDKNYEIDALGLLRDEYNLRGDYKNALQYARRLDSVKTSSFLDTRNQQVAETEAIFQNKAKANRIAAQQLQLEKQKTDRNRLLGIGATLILGALSTVYFFYNQKKQAEQKISLKEEQLKNLEQQQKLLALDYMMQGQEEERKRIAQDLHDGLGGLLTSVRHQVVSIQEQINQLSETNIIDKTEEMITAACDEVRRISHDMMPASLVSLGLVNAIEDLIEDISASSQIKASLITDGEIDPLPEKIKVNLYRIIQEGIHNTVKHAQAKELVITLHRSEREIRLIISDDGIGIKTDESNSSKGIGLKNIKSRTRYLDGILKIETNRGTELTLRIPLQTH